MKLKHFGFNIEKRFFIIKAKGKKDITKLVKKYIVDKNGRGTYVYVKPEEEHIGKKIFNILLSLLGLKTKNEVNKKIYNDYLQYKDELGGISFKVWVFHLKEYLLHKNSWDSYFRGLEEKKDSKEITKKEPSQKDKKEKTEKIDQKKIDKETSKTIKHEFKNKPLQIEILRKIYELYNGSNRLTESIETQTQEATQPQDILQIQQTPKTNLPSTSIVKKINEYTYQIGKNTKLEKADKSIIRENYIPANIINKLHPHEVDTINHIISNYLKNGTGTISINAGHGFSSNLKTYAALFYTLKQIEPNKFHPIIFHGNLAYHINPTEFIQALKELTGEEFNNYDYTHAFVKQELKEPQKNDIVWIHRRTLEAQSNAYEFLFKEPDNKDKLGLPIYIADTSDKKNRFGEIIPFGGNSSEAVVGYTEGDNANFASIAFLNEGFLFSFRSANVFRNPFNLFIIAKTLGLSTRKVMEYLGYRFHTIKKAYQDEFGKWVNVIQNVFTYLDSPTGINGRKDKLEKFITFLAKENKININVVKDIPFKLKITDINVSDEKKNELKRNLGNSYNDIKAYGMKTIPNKKLDDTEIGLIRLHRLSKLIKPSKEQIKEIVANEIKNNDSEVHIINPTLTSDYVLKHGYTDRLIEIESNSDYMTDLLNEIYEITNQQGYTQDTIGDINLGWEVKNHLHLKPKSIESKKKKIIFLSPPQSGDEFYKHILQSLDNKIENIDKYDLEIEILSKDKTIDTLNLKNLTEFLSKHNPSAELNFDKDMVSESKISELKDHLKKEFDIPNHVVDHYSAMATISDFIYDFDPTKEVDISLEQFKPDEIKEEVEIKPIKSLKNFREAFYKFPHNNETQFNYDIEYPDFIVDFGKYQGKKISEIKKNHYDYYRFIMISAGIDPDLFKIKDYFVKKSYTNLTNLYIINKDIYKKVLIVN